MDLVLHKGLGAVYVVSIFHSSFTAACKSGSTAHAQRPAGIQTFFSLIEDQRLALWHHHARQ